MSVPQSKNVTADEADVFNFPFGEKESDKCDINL